MSLNQVPLLGERAGLLSSSMQLPRSAHLSQRTALSSLASFLTFTAVLLTQHAFAAYEGSITHEDHNHPRLKGALEVDGGHDLESYEPEFIGADRSIIGRAGEVIQELGNNAPGTQNIAQSATQYWIFPSKTLFGPNSPQTPGLPSYFKGQNVSVTPDLPGEKELYISLTTCLQPPAQDPNPNGAPDQLKLYVSTSSNNQQPDEKQNDYAVPVDGGFGWLNISVKSDVYFGVSAPANDGYEGVYNYQLAASIDGFYASSYNYQIVDFVDSDTNSALLLTNNTTSTSNSSNSTFQQWMTRWPPVFTLFVQNQDNPSIQGLQNSICGLQNLAQIQGLPDVQTGMTAAGDGLPRQQFHVGNLNGSSAYYAIAAMIGNSTDQGSGVVGGGGTVWSSASFMTKTFENCALLFNLTFCTSVAYAAPANPETFNTTGLARQYDQYAQNLYQNFTYSLQQIPCNTTSSAQYSLARNCDDCDAAYRQWLCAVTIPRCVDYSNTSSYLQPRAVNQSFIDSINSSYAVKIEHGPEFSEKNRAYFNSSRNPMIDTVIRPGPYKELLPCSDICYNLVRSCPAALQFACPLEGHGLNYSYGSPHSGCNSPWPGMSGAAGLRPTGLVAFYAALIAAFMATM